jgi:hypothetical protein
LCTIKLYAGLCVFLRYATLFGHDPLWSNGL